MRSLGGTWSGWRRALAVVTAVVVVVAGAGCDGGSSLPEAGSGAPAPASSEVGGPAPSVPESVVIDPGSTVGRVDERLLGTNVAAWLGAERFEQAELLDALERSGASLIRMPGGSWSNYYDWLACETGDEDGCYWTWAARPADFAGLLRSTGLPGMWTVNVNETAEQAAALVAYFNGDVDDATAIGVDRDGVDWGTVGRWAALRAEGGHADPVGIRWWEVGNEVFGGTPEAGGEECASFGWETVWTCSGTEYVLGDGDHDGYLAIREAMLAVDPSIEVGAVGVVEPSEWSNWGNEVIEATAGELDFYVVHNYGFNESRPVEEIVDRPREYWPDRLALLRDVLGATPVALTEHNLVSFASGDTERTMTHASNAIFLAETIGQLALGGVSMANHWDFTGGTQDSGTNYGLIDVDSLVPFPTFFTFAMWSRFGEDLLTVDVPPDLEGVLGVYAGRRGDGRLTVIVVNRDADPVAARLEVSTGSIASAVVDTLSTDEPASSAASYNGVAAEAIDVVSTPGRSLVPDDDGAVLLDVPAWSVNLIEIETNT